MSPPGWFLSDPSVQVNPGEMGSGRRGCFTRAEPRASRRLQLSAAQLAAAVGTQALPGFCFSELGENTFPPPLSGKQETDSYKDSPTYRLGRKKVEFGNIKICSSNADQ